jgi:acid phosphatase
MLAVATACAPGAPGSQGSNERAGELARSAGPNAYHFVAIADWGTGYSIQHDLGRRMCELHDEHPFDIVVTAGDNIYEVGARSAFQEKFYEPFACLFNRDVRFHSTLGNHDIQTRNGRPELNEERFGMDGRNYVVREGGVRFVMVDSNNLRKDWLRGALDTEDSDRWTIVVFHHPVYSPSDHHPEDNLRPALPRMFVRKNVDLVINGHAHVYAVTKRLKDIRYVTTGGGSASLHECSPRWYTQRCLERYEFLSIEAGHQAIHVTAIPPSGDPIDTFRTEGR